MIRDSAYSPDLRRDHHTIQGMTQTALDARTHDFLLQYFPDLGGSDGSARVIDGFYPSPAQGWVMVFLGDGSIRMLFIGGAEPSDPQRLQRNEAWHFLQNGDVESGLAIRFVDAFRRAAEDAWTSHTEPADSRVGWAVLAHADGLEQLRKGILMINRRMRQKVPGFPQWVVDTAHTAYEAAQLAEKTSIEKPPAN